MQIYRLRLVNFRQHADTALDFETGLTGITGQKELAVMAQMSAPERAQFLSRVLGYEKLRTAQQRLKERRRVLQATLDARRSELADPGQLAIDEELAATRLRAAEESAARVA